MVDRLGGTVAVAHDHAVEMYRTGYIGHESPVTGTVADRARSAGAAYRVVGENLALTPGQVAAVENN